MYTFLVTNLSKSKRSLISFREAYKKFAQSQLKTLQERENQQENDQETEDLTADGLEPPDNVKEQYMTELDNVSPNISCEQVGILPKKMSPRPIMLKSRRNYHTSSIFYAKNARKKFNNTRNLGFTSEQAQVLYHRAMQDCRMIKDRQKKYSVKVFQSNKRSSDDDATSQKSNESKHSGKSKIRYSPHSREVVIVHPPPTFNPILQTKVYKISQGMSASRQAEAEESLKKAKPKPTSQTYVIGKTMTDIIQYKAAQQQKQQALKLTFTPPKLTEKPKKYEEDVAKRLEVTPYIDNRYARQFAKPVSAPSVLEAKKERTRVKPNKEPQTVSENKQWRYTPKLAKIPTYIPQNDRVSPVGKLKKQFKAHTSKKLRDDDMDTLSAQSVPTAGKLKEQFKLKMLLPTSAKLDTLEQKSENIREHPTRRDRIPGVKVKRQGPQRTQEDKKPIEAEDDPEKVVSHPQHIVPQEGVQVKYHRRVLTDDNKNYDIDEQCIRDNTKRGSSVSEPYVDLQTKERKSELYVDFKHKVPARKTRTDDEEGTPIETTLHRKAKLAVEELSNFVKKLQAFKERTAMHRNTEFMKMFQDKTQGIKDVKSLDEINREAWQRTIEAQNTRSRSGDPGTTHKGAEGHKEDELENRKDGEMTLTGGGQLSPRKKDHDRFPWGKKQNQDEEAIREATAEQMRALEAGRKAAAEKIIAEQKRILEDIRNKGAERQYSRQAITLESLKNEHTIFNSPAFMDEKESPRTQKIATETNNKNIEQYFGHPFSPQTKPRDQNDIQDVYVAKDQRVNNPTVMNAILTQYQRKNEKERRLDNRIRAVVTEDTLQDSRTRKVKNEILKTLNKSETNINRKVSQTKERKEKQGKNDINTKEATNNEDIYFKEHTATEKEDSYHKEHTEINPVIDVTGIVEMKKTDKSVYGQKTLSENYAEELNKNKNLVIRYLSLDLPKNSLQDDVKFERFAPIQDTMTAEAHTPRQKKTKADKDKSRTKPTEYFIDRKMLEENAAMEEKINTEKIEATKQKQVLQPNEQNQIHIMRKQFIYKRGGPRTNVARRMKDIKVTKMLEQTGEKKETDKSAEKSIFGNKARVPPIRKPPPDQNKKEKPKSGKDMVLPPRSQNQLPKSKGESTRERPKSVPSVKRRERTPAKRSARKSESVDRYKPQSQDNKKISMKSRTLSELEKLVSNTQDAVEKSKELETKELTEKVKWPQKPTQPAQTDSRKTKSDQTFKWPWITAETMNSIEKELRYMEESDGEKGTRMSARPDGSKPYKPPKGMYTGLEEDVTNLDNKEIEECDKWLHNIEDRLKEMNKKKKTDKKQKNAQGLNDSSAPRILNFSTREKKFPETVAKAQLAEDTTRLAKKDKDQLENRTENVEETDKDTPPKGEKVYQTKKSRSVPRIYKIDTKEGEDGVPTKTRYKFKTEPKIKRPAPRKRIVWPAVVQKNAPGVKKAQGKDKKDNYVVKYVIDADKKAEPTTKDKPSDKSDGYSDKFMLDEMQILPKMRVVIEILNPPVQQAKKKVRVNKKPDETLSSEAVISDKLFDGIIQSVTADHEEKQNVQDDFVSKEAEKMAAHLKPDPLAKPEALQIPEGKTPATENKLKIPWCNFKCNINPYVWESSKFDEKNTGGKTNAVENLAAEKTNAKTGDKEVKKIDSQNVKANKVKDVLPAKSEVQNETLKTAKELAKPAKSKKDGIGFRADLPKKIRSNKLGLNDFKEDPMKKNRDYIVRPALNIEYKAQKYEMNGEQSSKLVEIFLKEEDECKPLLQDYKINTKGAMDTEYKPLQNFSKTKPEGHNTATKPVDVRKPATAENIEPTSLQNGATSQLEKFMINTKPFMDNNYKSLPNEFKDQKTTPVENKTVAKTQNIVSKPLPSASASKLKDSIASSSFYKASERREQTPITKPQLDFVANVQELQLQPSSEDYKNLEKNVINFINSNRLNLGMQPPMSLSEKLEPSEALEEIGEMIEALKTDVKIDYKSMQKELGEDVKSPVPVEPGWAKKAVAKASHVGDQDGDVKEKPGNKSNSIMVVESVKLLQVGRTIDDGSKDKLENKDARTLKKDRTEVIQSKSRQFSTKGKSETNLFNVAKKIKPHEIKQIVRSKTDMGKANKRFPWRVGNQLSNTAKTTDSVKATAKMSTTERIGSGNTGKGNKGNNKISAIFEIKPGGNFKILKKASEEIASPQDLAKINEEIAQIKEEIDKICEKYISSHKRVSKPKEDWDNTLPKIDEDLFKTSGIFVKASPNELKLQNTQSSSKFQLKPKKRTKSPDSGLPMSAKTMANKLEAVTESIPQKSKRKDTCLFKVSIEEVLMKTQGNDLPMVDKNLTKTINAPQKEEPRETALLAHVRKQLNKAKLQDSDLPKVNKNLTDNALVKIKPAETCSSKTVTGQLKIKVDSELPSIKEEEALNEETLQEEIKIKEEIKPQDIDKPLLKPAKAINKKSFQKLKSSETGLAAAFKDKIEIKQAIKTHDCNLPKNIFKAKRTTTENSLERHTPSPTGMTSLVTDHLTLKKESNLQDSDCHRSEKAIKSRDSNLPTPKPEKVIHEITPSVKMEGKSETKEEDKLQYRKSTGKVRLEGIEDNKMQGVDLLTWEKHMFRNKYKDLPMPETDLFKPESELKNKEENTVQTNDLQTFEKNLFKTAEEINKTKGTVQIIDLQTFAKNLFKPDIEIGVNSLQKIEPSAPEVKGQLKLKEGKPQDSDLPRLEKNLFKAQKQENSLQKVKAEKHKDQLETKNDIMPNDNGLPTSETNAFKHEGQLKNKTKDTVQIIDLQTFAKNLFKPDIEIGGNSLQKIEPLGSEVKDQLKLKEGKPQDSDLPMLEKNLFKAQNQEISLQKVKVEKQKDQLETKNHIMPNDNGLPTSETNASKNEGQLKNKTKDTVQIIDLQTFANNLLKTDIEIGGNSLQKIEPSGPEVKDQLKLKEGNKRQNSDLPWLEKNLLKAQNQENSLQNVKEEIRSTDQIKPLQTKNEIMPNNNGLPTSETNVVKPEGQLKNKTNETEHVIDLQTFAKNLFKPDIEIGGNSLQKIKPSGPEVKDQLKLKEGNKRQNSDLPWLEKNLLKAQNQENSLQNVKEEIRSTEQIKPLQTKNEIMPNNNGLPTSETNVVKPEGQLKNKTNETEHVIDLQTFAKNLFKPDIEIGGNSLQKIEPSIRSITVAKDQIEIKNEIKSETNAFKPEGLLKNKTKGTVQIIDFQTFAKDPFKADIELGGKSLQKMEPSAPEVKDQLKLKEGNKPQDCDIPRLDKNLFHAQNQEKSQKVKAEICLTTDKKDQLQTTNKITPNNNDLPMTETNVIKPDCQLKNKTKETVQIVDLQIFEKNPFKTEKEIKDPSLQKAEPPETVIKDQLKSKEYNMSHDSDLSRLNTNLFQPQHHEKSAQKVNKKNQLQNKNEIRPNNNDLPMSEANVFRPEGQLKNNTKDMVQIVDLKTFEKNLFKTKKEINGSPSEPSGTVVKDQIKLKEENKAKPVEICLKEAVKDQLDSKEEKKPQDSDLSKFEKNLFQAQTVQQKITEDVCLKEDENKPRDSDLPKLEQNLFQAQTQEENSLPQKTKPSQICLTTMDKGQLHIEEVNKPQDSDLPKLEKNLFQTQKQEKSSEKINVVKGHHEKKSKGSDLPKKNLFQFQEEKLHFNKENKPQDSDLPKLEKDRLQNKNENKPQDNKEIPEIGSKKEAKSDLPVSKESVWEHGNTTNANRSQNSKLPENNLTTLVKDQAEKKKEFKEYMSQANRETPSGGEKASKVNHEPRAKRLKARKSCSSVLRPVSQKGNVSVRRVLSEASRLDTISKHVRVKMSNANLQKEIKERQSRLPINLRTSQVESKGKENVNVLEIEVRTPTVLEIEIRTPITRTRNEITKEETCKEVESDLPESRQSVWEHGETTNATSSQNSKLPENNSTTGFNDQALLKKSENAISTNSLPDVKVVDTYLSKILEEKLQIKEEPQLKDKETNKPHETDLPVSLKTTIKKELSPNIQAHDTDFRTADKELIKIMSAIIQAKKRDLLLQMKNSGKAENSQVTQQGITPRRDDKHQLQTAKEEIGDYNHVPVSKEKPKKDKDDLTRLNDNLIVSDKTLSQSNKVVKQDQKELKGEKTPKFPVNYLQKGGQKLFKPDDTQLKDNDQKQLDIKKVTKQISAEVSQPVCRKTPKLDDQTQFKPEEIDTRETSHPEVSTPLGDDKRLKSDEKLVKMIETKQNDKDSQNHTSHPVVSKPLGDNTTPKADAKLVKMIETKQNEKYLQKQTSHPEVSKPLGGDTTPKADAKLVKMIETKQNEKYLQKQTSHPEVSKPLGDDKTPKADGKLVKMIETKQNDKDLQNQTSHTEVSKPLGDDKTPKADGKLVKMIETKQNVKNLQNQTSHPEVSKALSDGKTRKSDKTLVKMIETIDLQIQTSHPEASKPLGDVRPKLKETLLKLTEPRQNDNDLPLEFKKMFQPETKSTKNEKQPSETTGIEAKDNKLPKLPKHQVTLITRSDRKSISLEEEIRQHCFNNLYHHLIKLLKVRSKLEIKNKYSESEINNLHREIAKVEERLIQIQNSNTKMQKNQTFHKNNAGNKNLNGQKKHYNTTTQSIQGRYKKIEFILDDLDVFYLDPKKIMSTIYVTNYDTSISKNDRKEEETNNEMAIKDAKHNIDVFTDLYNEVTLPIKAKILNIYNKKVRTEQPSKAVPTKTNNPFAKFEKLLIRNKTNDTLPNTKCFNKEILFPDAVDKQRPSKIILQNQEIITEMNLAAKYIANRQKRLQEETTSRREKKYREYMSQAKLGSPSGGEADFKVNRDTRTKRPKTRKTFNSVPPECKNNAVSVKPPRAQSEASKLDSSSNNLSVPQKETPRQVVLKDLRNKMSNNVLKIEIRTPILDIREEETNVAVSAKCTAALDPSSSINEIRLDETQRSIISKTDLEKEVEVRQPQLPIDLKPITGFITSPPVPAYTKTPPRPSLLPKTKTGRVVISKVNLKKEIEDRTPSLNVSTKTSAALTRPSSINEIPKEQPPKSVISKTHLQLPETVSKTDHAKEIGERQSQLPLDLKPIVGAQPRIPMYLKEDTISKTDLSKEIGERQSQRSVDLKPMVEVEPRVPVHLKEETISKTDLAKAIRDHQLQLHLDLKPMVGAEPRVPLHLKEETISKTDLAKEIGERQSQLPLDLKPVEAEPRVPIHLKKTISKTDLTDFAKEIGEHQSQLPLNLKPMVEAEPPIPFHLKGDTISKTDLAKEIGERQSQLPLDLKPVVEAESRAPISLKDTISKTDLTKEIAERQSQLPLDLKPMVEAEPRDPLNLKEGTILTTDLTKEIGERQSELLLNLKPMLGAESRVPLHLKDETISKTDLAKEIEERQSQLPLDLKPMVGAEPRVPLHMKEETISKTDLTKEIGERQSQLPLDLKPMVGAEPRVPLHMKEETISKTDLTKEIGGTISKTDLKKEIEDRQPELPLELKPIVGAEPRAPLYLKTNSGLSMLPKEKPRRAVISKLNLQNEIENRRPHIPIKSKSTLAETVSSSTARKKVQNEGIEHSRTKSQIPLKSKTTLGETVLLTSITSKTRQNFEIKAKEAQKLVPHLVANTNLSTPRPKAKKEGIMTKQKIDPKAARQPPTPRSKVLREDVQKTQKQELVVCVPRVRQAKAVANVKPEETKLRKDILLGIPYESEKIQTNVDQEVAIKNPGGSSDIQNVAAISKADKNEGVVETDNQAGLEQKESLVNIIKGVAPVKGSSKEATGIKDSAAADLEFLAKIEAITENLVELNQKVSATTIQVSNALESSDFKKDSKEANKASASATALEKDLDILNKIEDTTKNFVENTKMEVETKGQNALDNAKGKEQETLPENNIQVRAEPKVLAEAKMFEPTKETDTTGVVAKKANAVTNSEKNIFEKGKDGPTETLPAVINPDKENASNKLSFFSMGIPTVLKNAFKSVIHRTPNETTESFSKELQKGVEVVPQIPPIESSISKEPGTVRMESKEPNEVNAAVKKESSEPKDVPVAVIKIESKESETVKVASQEPKDTLETFIVLPENVYEKATVQPKEPKEPKDVPVAVIKIESKESETIKVASQEPKDTLETFIVLPKNVYEKVTVQPKEPKEPKDTIETFIVLPKNVYEKVTVQPKEPKELNSLLFKEQEQIQGDVAPEKKGTQEIEEVRKLITNKDELKTIITDKDELRTIITPDTVQAKHYVVAKDVETVVKKKMQSRNPTIDPATKKVVSKKPVCGQRVNPCAKLVLPKKSPMLQITAKEAVESPTTMLEKPVGDKIKKPPKLPPYKPKVVDKYKHLKTTYMTLKDNAPVFLPPFPEKKVPNEPIPRSKFTEQELQILIMKFDFLKRMWQEFQGQENLRKNSNFERVCKYYEKTVGSDKQPRNLEVATKKRHLHLKPHLKPSFERIVKYYAYIMNEEGKNDNSQAVVVKPATSMKKRTQDIVVKTDTDNKDKNPKNVRKMCTYTSEDGGNGNEGPSGSSKF